MNYYSPELVRYIQGTADAGELTEASDIFALGPDLHRVPHRVACRRSTRPTTRPRSRCCTASGYG